MISDIRSILNLFEALGEFEYPVPTLPAWEFLEGEVYVQYTKEGVILSGEGISDDNFFSDKDGGEEYGALDFKVNITTNKINIRPEDYSGERYVYPNEDYMEEVVREIVEAFTNEYGTDWTNIYKRLHKGGRASAQKPTHSDELDAIQSEFKKQALRLYSVAPKILHSAFVRMRRAGATKEQLESLTIFKNKLDETRWKSLARHAINSHGHNEVDWFARKNYTTADLTELIELIIKYIVEQLMSPMGWRINSLYPGF